jgi:uncharacterized protein
MKNNRLSAEEWGERIVLALLFIVIGGLVYLVFSPLRPMLHERQDYLGRIGLIVFLLAAFLLVRRSARLQKYAQVVLGMLIMTSVVFLDRVFSIFIIVYLGVGDTTPAGWAIQKVNEAAVVICALILFTNLSGGSLGSIYLQKGNLKLGLTIGLIAFCLAAAGSALMAGLLFKGQNLSFARIFPWIPWLLIFVLANAAQEELLFRGLFLRKLQPFFGKFLSNLLIVFIFTFLHRAANYTSNLDLFIVVLVPLALAWGYVMQKTDSVWGSILFHSGMDIPIMLGIFSNLS